MHIHVYDLKIVKDLNGSVKFARLSEETILKGVVKQADGQKPSVYNTCIEADRI